MRVHNKTFQKKSKKKISLLEKKNVEIRKAIAVPSNKVARNRWIFS